MYRYETHLHTFPVSKCASCGVKETLDFYKRMGFDGVFITNHFLDGNINVDEEMSYEEKINFYFSDYEEGKKLSENIGIKVFLGIEMTYKGTDFLVFGIDKQWFLSHPDIINMPKSKQLLFLIENGALVIHAHPFREAAYIDHIRLFPRCVHGVEVVNACRTPFENEMARLYAKSYNLLEFAGSDNHEGCNKKLLAGMCSEECINSVEEFISFVKSGKMKVFSTNNE